MNQDMNRKGRVTVFAAGGCGVNIGLMLEKHRGVKEPAFAEIDIVYVDTSHSNMRPNIDPAHCYLLDGLDGSGKVRSENHNVISDRVRAILQQFKPADLNVVLSSAGGGSGSVIGPLLVRELITSEIPTIVLAIGSADTRLDCENTLKTIKSYESIAKMSKAPVVMMYVQNSNTTSREEADVVMVNAIMSLCVLYSRENREIDSRDLFNWLRFDRVTTYPVQLASLSIVLNQNDIKDVGNVISVATLVKDGMHTALPSMPEYQCSGFLPEVIEDSVANKAPLHFVVSDGIIGEVGKHLQKILTELQHAQDARIRVTGVLTPSDKPIETGLIL